MSDERVLELWTRLTSGGDLTANEEQELLQALERDEGLRRRLLRNDQVDGLLRGLGQGSPEVEAFVRSFSGRLAAERDATRFIEKMQPWLPKESESSLRARGESPEVAKARSRRSPRTWVRRPGATQTYWKVGFAAAGVVVAVILFLTVSSPSPVSSGEAEAARLRAQREEQRRQESLARGEARRKAEAAAERARGEQERLTRELAAVEAQRQKLEAARKDAPPEADRRQAEEELERVAARFREKTAELARAKEASEKARKDVPPTPEPTVPAPKAQQTQVAVAKVGHAENAVLVTKDGDRAPAQAGRDVLAGQALEVLAGGSARLEYPDQTQIEVGPETEVREIKSEKGKRLSVSRGTVRAVVAKQPKGEPMIFATASGDATVLGTTLRLVVDPDPKKGTRLEVEEGKVDLKNLEGKTVLVESGHYAVAATGVPLVPRKIPAPAVAQLEEKGTFTINFGPDGLKLPEGILNDSGQEYDSKRGYGWKGPIVGPPIPGAFWIDNDGKPQPAFAGRAASEVSPPDVLRGTYVRAGWANQMETWKILLPNGRYLVSLMVGYTDDGREPGPHHVRLQGKLVVDAAMTRKGAPVFKEGLEADVRNGELTMIVGGHLSDLKGYSGTSYTRLNYVVIKRASK